MARGIIGFMLNRWWRRIVRPAPSWVRALSRAQRRALAANLRRILDPKRSLPAR
jgi:hypothetical protein